MIITHLASLALQAAPGFDPETATQAYLATLDGAARARSDSYFEGGYWLILANFVIGLAVAGFLLQSGFAKTLRDKLRAAVKFNWLTTLIFAAVYSLITSILTFPMTLYEGFYREHAFNLSTMTLPDWFGEWAINLGVSTLMFAIFITTLYAVIRIAKASWWLWGTALSVAFLGFMLFLSPVYIDPLFNDYQPMEAGELRDDILSVAHANGIPADDVFVFDVSRQSNRITANVSGLFGTTRIALSDTLIENTDRDEVMAVMAHEMGHYVLNHIWEMFAMFALLLAIGFAITNGLFGWANRVMGRKWGVTDIGDIAGLPLLLACLSVFFFATTPIFNTIIRTNEAAADLFGLNAAREPDGSATVDLRLASYRKIEPGALEEWFMFDHPSGRARVFMAMQWKAGQLELGAADQTPDLRIDRAEAIAAELEAANAE
ncbi:M48 family metallopeptidase [uncultured Maricaulis sp.]|uniref:M48 family metallopeptidase n=1 Tax=uncultured Maricaulis sp. TaxID=174710 RepID=UPI0030DDDE62|tara:strand:- start:90281 stop:91579 length:1299 start_codon:yes stop_codon:yes gene_type:complete